MQFDVASRVSRGQVLPSFVVKAFFLVLLVLVASILALLLTLRPGLGRLEATVDRLAFEQRARAIGAEYLASERFEGHRIFCAHDLSASPLCRAVTFAPFAALGDHPPLWVLLDGLNEALKAPAAARAPDVLRAWADLLVSLSAHGTLAQLSGKGETGSYSAIDLYMATLAQARICMKLQPEVTCASGLPVPVRQALGAAARLLAADLGADAGAATPLAESHRRAARSLLESGLVQVL